MRYINSILQDKCIKKFSDTRPCKKITFGMRRAITIERNSDNISNIPDISEWIYINELSNRNRYINVTLHPIHLTGKRKKIIVYNR